MNESNSSWKGLATDLLEHLSLDDMAVNVFTRKLNVLAERLYSEHGIRYQSNRLSAGRMISLTKE